MISLRPEYVTRALLVVLVAAFVFTILRPGNQALAVGETAPDFGLMDLGGRRMQLSDYRGKVVVLNFWATWCPPCVDEMPSLNRFAAAYEKKGVAVLAVSVDDDEQALRRFVDTHQLKMPVLRDPGRTVSTQYQTYKYPETYILDRQGRLIRKIVGPEDWSSSAILSFFDGLT